MGPGRHFASKPRSVAPGKVVANALAQRDPALDPVDLGWHLCQLACAKWQSYMSAYRCPQAHLRDPHATFASWMLCSQPSLCSGCREPKSGANKYVMHFPKGETQPADGFWSITMYYADYFFVDN
jgi:hypothetical protein